MNDTDVAYTTHRPARTGYVPDNSSAIRQVLRKSAAFAPEDDCETDPDRRELVVYTVVWRKRGGRPEVLVGQRQPDAGEGRLHGNLTIGWGGNVERQDFQADGYWADHPFQGAAYREIEEELAVDFKATRASTYHGILNDPSDDVGKDHIGLVYSVQVADATVRERDKYGEGEWWPVVGDGWLTHEPIGGKLFANHDKMESWSQLLSGHVRDMVGGGQ